jgi:hypothetical protein
VHRGEAYARRPTPSLCSDLISDKDTRFRGIDRVGWAFTFTAAAYNLIRLPKLLAGAR